MTSNLKSVDLHRLPIVDGEYNVKFLHIPKSMLQLLLIGMIKLDQQMLQHVSAVFSVLEVFKLNSIYLSLSGIWEMFRSFGEGVILPS